LASFLSRNSPTDSTDEAYFDLALSPWEAMLGAEVKVPTLDGELLLTVPPGTGSGKKLRLRGHGMPLGTAAKRGDMYALVRVDVPKHLSAQEHTLIEELSRLSTFAPRATPTGN
jgi:curved DNA-binding protein